MKHTVPGTGVDGPGVPAGRWPRLVLVPLTGAVFIAGAMALALSWLTGHAAASLIPVLPTAMAIAFWIPTAAFLYQYERGRRVSAARAAADFDALTGILNRGALMARATRVFAARERRGEHVGVFFIDVDSFKQVNDRHGHEFGDQYLRHIAWQVSALVRETDLVGRMGGDEFVAVLPGIDRARMREIAERLVAAMRKPFSDRGASINGGISVGCHLSPPGEGPIAAFDLADGAAYQAKMLGRGRVVEFTGALAKARERRERLVAALTRAVQDGDFDIHYQPVFAVADGRLTGFEALPRLTLPGGAPVNPAEVLPLAESTGMIVPLGIEVLRRAARLAARWPGEISLSLDLSPVQFRSGDLPRSVFAVLEETGIDPDRLILEITERVLAEGGEQPALQLAELRAAGIAIAIDHFGAGSASIGHLWAHRFDCIKVESALQEAHAFDPDRYRPMFEVIADLGRRLGIPVTLTGIENARNAGLARDLGCAAYQGTWLGRPVPAAGTLDLASPVERATARPVTGP